LVLALALAVALAFLSVIPSENLLLLSLIPTLTSKLKAKS